MNRHTKVALESISCPFALDFKAIKWEKVTKIVSVDDSRCSVIVLLNTEEIYLVEIPCILYQAVFKSGVDDIQFQEE